MDVSDRHWLTLRQSHCELCQRWLRSVVVSITSSHWPSCCSTRSDISMWTFHWATSTETPWFQFQHLFAIQNSWPRWCWHPPFAYEFIRFGQIMHVTVGVTTAQLVCRCGVISWFISKLWSFGQIWCDLCRFETFLRIWPSFAGCTSRMSARWLIGDLGSKGWFINGMVCKTKSVNSEHVWALYRQIMCCLVFCS